MPAREIRRPIAILPEALASQIAAGEVVERPASVLKELVENSLDAGATRVDVVIEGGGADLLQVVDDGDGIPPEELPLAVAPHATSKVRSMDELVAVGTLGFRGEALASVASVSRLRIVSRVRGATDAASLQVDAGKVGGVSPAAGPAGTLMEVRNLFAAVPARRKFLKTPRAEAARCADAMELLSLAHPSVSFRLQSDGRVIVDLPATDHARRRILSILADAGEGALEVHAECTVADPDSMEEQRVRLWGLVCRPEHARARSGAQRLLVNGRPIQDRALVSAVREAFRGLVEPGALPPLVLLLSMPPELVDVNVHPAKTEVRFRHPSTMWRLVRDGVRQALRAASLVPQAAELLGKAIPMEAPRSSGGGVSLPHTGPSAMSGEALPIHHESPTLGSQPMAPVPIARILGGTDAVLQVARTWLVFEEDGALVVADQHALHERVMFESLKERITREALPSQRQLLPDVTSVSAAAMARLDSLLPVLMRIGYDIAAAGPRSIAVSGVPVFLLERGVEPLGFVKSILEEPHSEGESPDEESVLASVLDMMACKAAVKGGDRLTGAEVAELLAMRDRIERATNCPHGRPTSVRIPLAEVEKRFGRR
ncbi:MAG: DNA mismatch repair endonuclease MutL [Planctomycetota bacterium]|nr:DNA mismatch repair endonuclease MutL [Planctomycetota bacterium]MDA1105512.1 DNA mismatch repair endonuclease MutL [Planctomycetota bacterium]